MLFMCVLLYALWNFVFMLKSRFAHLLSEVLKAIAVPASVYRTTPLISHRFAFRVCTAKGNYVKSLKLTASGKRKDGQDVQNVAK